MKKLWENYSLSLVLAILFLTAWALQTWTGWVQFAAEQQQHGESAHWLGQSGYIWSWAESTMENWQSEFLQLLAFVTLTSFLMHRGSPESKDSDEQTKLALQRIERRLDSMDGKLINDLRREEPARAA
jgi:hypothetical protein